MRKKPCPPPTDATPIVETLARLYDTIRNLEAQIALVSQERDKAIAERDEARHEANILFQ